MKASKAITTERILNFAATRSMPCTKLELKNVIFPKWSDIGLLGMIFRQNVVTKEQPEGNIYDEAKFQTTLRVIKGKVLMSGRPDCYCWKFDKIKNAKDVRIIGSNSADGIINLSEVLTEISDTEEKKMVADMFASLNKDLLLVTTPAEARTCLEVTSELYNLGITYCVDEWMDEDENGEATATELSIGDFLIIGESGVYCIRRQEFLETHSIDE